MDSERLIPYYWRRKFQGYGQVFVQAGRQNNIDPAVLAIISAHESAGWKSRNRSKKEQLDEISAPTGA